MSKKLPPIGNKTGISVHERTPSGRKLPPKKPGKNRWRYADRENTNNLEDQQKVDSELGFFVDGIMPPTDYDWRNYFLQIAKEVRDQERETNDSVGKIMGLCEYLLTIEEMWASDRKLLLSQVISNSELAEDAFLKVREMFEEDATKTVLWFFANLESLNGDRPIDYLLTGREKRLIKLIDSALT